MPIIDAQIHLWEAHRPDRPWPAESIASPVFVAAPVSALPCYTTQPYPFANLTPYLKRIVGTFGPRRLMWGSDITRLPCTYTECLDHFRKELTFLSEKDKEWILGRTLAQWLGW